MGIERDTKRSYGTASSESGATRLDATRIVSSVSANEKSADAADFVVLVRYACLPRRTGDIDVDASLLKRLSNILRTVDTEKTTSKRYRVCIARSICRVI
ncbi:hypothetical protein EVAR_84738_1 [Eumeta japonica]|uniref:Uncharacterized protein n=1 Tax=Eumeta variegata TaxID=151549 RepID=A0A4C1VU75_EUMVA|nr:hypothetical protein EVAR_84738_1 [Eumeta japonica]